MKKDKIYITTMYLHGDRNKYSYLAYVGHSKKRAIYVSEIEGMGRDLKPEIIEYVPGEINNNKVIIELSETPEMFVVIAGKRCKK